MVPAFTGLGAPTGTAARSRHHRRDDPRHRQRTHRAGDARKYRLPDPRRGRGHGGRLRRRDDEPPGRRWCGQEQLPLSAPVGHHPDGDRPAEVDETTALGSAYAAGLAVGYWDTVDELRDNWQIDREFTPEKGQAEVDKLYSRWDDAVEERSLNWAQDDEEDE